MFLVSLLLLSVSSLVASSNLPIVDRGYERHQALTYNVRSVASLIELAQ